MILKIVTSAINAPNPPIKAAKKIFSVWTVKKNPTAKGAVNPNENKIPAIKLPRQLKLFNSTTKSRT